MSDLIVSAPTLRTMTEQLSAVTEQASFDGELLRSGDDVLQSSTVSPALASGSASQAARAALVRTALSDIARMPAKAADEFLAADSHLASVWRGTQ